MHIYVSVRFISFEFLFKPRLVENSVFGARLSANRILMDIQAFSSSMLLVPTSGSLIRQSDQSDQDDSLGSLGYASRSAASWKHF